MKEESQSNAALGLELLLVEDDFSDAKALRRLLEKSRMPYHLTWVLDGVEAVEYFHARGGQMPAGFLVLTDINMPRMGGLELLKEVRCNPTMRDCPVYVMSTSASPDDSVAAQHLGASGYFCKRDVDRDPSKLISALQGHLASVRASTVVQ